jgi:hypothetical protein
MARPAGDEWQPLGWDTDPVPGDPQEISAEAAHLARVAQDITGQVAALRKISADGVQIGQSPEAIRTAAQTLAGDLAKVAVRYQKVAAALRGWSPELEQAQRMSVQALDQAEIPYARLRQQAILPSGSHLTAAQQQEVASYHAAMRRAEDELDAARALLGRAISLRDTQAAYYQAKIDDASHDSLADSWWDHVENWVDHHAGLLSDICTALEYVATGLAVAALIFSGVGILVVLGIAATALALAGRTLLAATGNGSWADVALDAFSLMAFGSGKWVGTLMARTFTLTEDTATGIIQATREASTLGRAGARLVRAAGWIEDSPVLRDGVSLLGRVGLRGLGDGLGQLASRFSGVLDRAGTAALEKASPPLERTLTAVSEKIRPGEAALYGGEEESLLMTRKMAAIAARFPHSEEIAGLRGQFTTYLNVQRTIFSGATLADAGDKIASAVPGAQGYRDFKDYLTTDGGLSTRQADGIVDILQPVPVAGAAAGGFRLVLGGGR